MSGSLDIAYLSPKRGEELVRELNQVFAGLCFGLQHITFNGTRLRLYNHTRQTADDVLHDICAFETFIIITDEAELIGTAAYTEGLK